MMVMKLFLSRLIISDSLSVAKMRNHTEYTVTKSETFEPLTLKIESLPTPSLFIFTHSFQPYQEWLKFCVFVLLPDGNMFFSFCCLKLQCGKYHQQYSKLQSAEFYFLSPAVGQTTHSSHLNGLVLIQRFFTQEFKTHFITYLIKTSTFFLCLSAF